MSSLKFLKYGSPLFIMVLGAPLALKEFQQLKFDYGQNKPIDRESLRESGLKVKDKKDVTLDAELDKMEEIDTDNWENKRGPRPWEEGNVLYEEAIQRKATIDAEKRTQK